MTFRKEMAFLVHDNSHQKKEKQTLGYNLMIRTVICLFISFICLFFIYLTIDSASSSSSLTFIQNSKLESYTDETIGKSLNSFFDQSTWEVLNDHMIKFSGQAYWGDQKATFSILFSVEPTTNTFDIKEYTINNNVQTYDDFILMLDTIYHKR